MAKTLALVACLAASTLMANGIADAAELLRVQGGTIKWLSQPSSVPIVVSYTALSGPYVVGGDRTTISPDNCGAMHAFADIVNKSPAVSIEATKRELAAAFAAWEQAADIRFVEVADARHADIIVGAADAPQGRAFANLSYRGRTPAGKALGNPGSKPPAATPESGGEEASVVAIEQAYICLNPRVPWKIGFDGDLSVYDLRYTFMHEIGHAIGLDHPGRSGALMGYRYDERLADLQPSDVAAARQLYGASKRHQ